MVWFKKTGWLYQPVHVAGWIVLALGIIFLVSVYSAYNARAHGFGDLTYKIFPHYVCTFLLYIWVGYNTSKKS